MLPDWLEKEAEVRPYQQETQYSCSAACLKAALEHYGISLPEAELIGLIGATPKRGAEVYQIVEAVHKMGQDCLLHEFADLDEAKWVLDQGMPIICDIQSFKHEGKGHYVLLGAIDGDRVVLMDPNCEGNRRVLTREHMDARWWDRTMAPPHGLKMRWGIIILPPRDQLSNP